jgi:hypothetical protein
MRTDVDVGPGESVSGQIGTFGPQARAQLTNAQPLQNQASNELLP